MPKSQKSEFFPSRSRAPQACLSCQARKVRCDAAYRNGTCTNCLLDHQECAMRAKTARRNTSSKRSLKIAHTPRGLGIDKNLTEPQGCISTANNSVDVMNGPNAEEAQDNIQYEEELYVRSVGKLHERLGASPGTGCLDPYGRSQTPVPKLDLRHLDDSSANKLDSHVIYSFLPFLQADLSQLSEDNVQFLDMQGSFKVPGEQALNEFIHVYFQHVHPTLPLLDESAFWEMYTRKTTSSRCMSLFVFQAMLFASSSFMSFKTIQRLGFSSLRHARTSYYRRAKLLFDFNVEPNRTSNAQGALLLSYNTSMQGCKRENSLWLATAVRLARDEGAHQHDRSQLQNSDERNILKQLWWSCRVQDRILSIGLRRRPVILSNGFHLSKEYFTKVESHNATYGSPLCAPGLPLIMGNDGMSLDQLLSGVVCEGLFSDQYIHSGDDYFEMPEKSEVRVSSQQEPENHAQQFAALELQPHTLEYITDVNSISGYVNPANLDFNNEENYFAHPGGYELFESHL